jgi:hypothetical protein
MVWISDNLGIFWPAAQEQYQKQGRGAIVVDTTVQPIGTGHPFTYLSQEEITEISSTDTQRMVQTYNPEREFVIVLLKERDRESTYRIQAMR